MKLPTLTAITLASAVLAAGPAFAATTPDAAAPAIPPPGTAAPPAGGAATTAVPGTTPALSADAATQNGASATTASPAAASDPSGTAAAPAAPSGAPASGAAGGAMATTEPPAGGMDTNATAPGHMTLSNNPPGTANVVPQTNGNNNDTNAKNERTPNERNPVLANDGLPRAGKVVGSGVYNSSDKKLGSVNDILLGERGHPDMVVLNLAQGDKRVLVPFREFVFGNTQISSNNRVILPNQTPISLAQLAPFHYDLKNNGNANNGVGNRAGNNEADNAMTAGGTGLGLVPVAPRAPVTTAMNGNESAVGANTMPPPATNANTNATAANTVTAPTDGDLSGAPIGTATVRASKGEIMRNGNANADALPHQRNPVLADDGLPRASKVIGSAVYNTDDQKVGSVDEILMGEKGAPDQAVITVNNGNNKRVLVPFKSLVFGNTRINSNNRVILPDQTEASLDHLAPFVYNGGNGNNG